jgi:hypothetical protein
MDDVIRRQILAGLSSMLLTVLPLGRPFASTAKAGTNRRHLAESDFFLGCIFAKRAGLPSVCCDGGLPSPLIDFWTARVSEIEINEMPPNIGRVVVWDDVFSRRRLAQSAHEIFAALARYYGFDFVTGSDNFAFHIEGFSEIGSMIAKVLPASSNVCKSPRIALIDIESCGVSRLDWPDLLPHLRAHYDLIVGFAHFAGRGPSHWSAVFADDTDYHSSTRTTIAHCDLSFLTSDALLGFDHVLDCDVRQPYLNTLLDELIGALSGVDFLKAVTGIAGVQTFGMGALPAQSLDNFLTSNAVERQRSIVLREFGNAGPKLSLVFAADDECRAPLLTQSLALWPLRPMNVA